MWKCSQCETINNDTQAICVICGLSREESRRMEERERLRREEAAREAARKKEEAAREAARRAEQAEREAAARKKAEAEREAALREERAAREAAARRAEAAALAASAAAEAEKTGVVRREADDGEEIAPKRGKGKEIAIGLIVGLVCVAVLGLVIALLVGGSREDPELSGYVEELDEELPQEPIVK